MDRLRKPRPELDALEPYDPREATAEIRLAANENPYNLPREIVAKLSERLAEVPFNRYPDAMANSLRDLIAEANGVERGNVLVGNGGDELIFDLVLAWGGRGRKLLDLPPTFAMYAIDAEMTGTGIVSIPRTEDFSVDADAALARLGKGDIDIVVIANPNNPTGGTVPETFLIDVLQTTDAMVLVDEAYFEFSRQTMRPHMERNPNLVMLRTFSKAFSLAGLRIGYLLAHEDVVTQLAKIRQPYSVDRFGQAVASVVFRERILFESVIHELVLGRDRLYEELSKLPGVTPFPSEANFVMFRIQHAPGVWRDLLHNHSILVRDLSRTPGLEDCLRVSVGTPKQNETFLDAMRKIAAERSRQAESAEVPAPSSRGGA